MDEITLIGFYTMGLLNDKIKYFVFGDSNDEETIEFHYDLESKEVIRVINGSMVGYPTDSEIKIIESLLPTKKEDFNNFELHFGNYYRLKSKNW